MQLQIIFGFVVFSGLFLGFTFPDTLFAQQELSPHQQWKESADPDTLTCKQGFLLLQKTNGYPVCVMPYTYLKLVERGYGSHDLSAMSKHHPEMLDKLLHYMVSNENLTRHWHEMMKKNSNVMTQTMDYWVLQMKNDPTLLKNLLGPITSDPKLREQMIQTMKNHPTMEIFLKQDPIWMESIHRPITDSSMEKDRDSMVDCPECSKLNKQKPTSSCSWCPEYEIQSMPEYSKTIPDSAKIMELVHDVWINSGMSKDVHDLMIEDPSHMAQMADQLMEPMLNAVMDDDVLRVQMIDLMLEHDDFMNSIRHANLSQGH